MEATLGSCRNPWQWLWTMGTDTGALSLMHPHRSTEAFAALSDAWSGLLVRDGSGVDHDGINQRQTCLAHLRRTARGWSPQRAPASAACGHWALKELQRLGHMAHSPPTGGQWQAGEARFCPLIARAHGREDDAAR